MWFNIIVKYKNEQERNIAFIGDGSNYLQTTMWDILDDKKVEYVRIERSK
jgi:hypothetical protein